MKFGLVGIGRFGKHYIKNLQEIEGSELVICSSRTPESYNVLPSELTNGVLWTDNINNILKADIDTLIIATHPDSHFKYARSALKAGKHVICEKPCMFSKEQRIEIDDLTHGTDNHFFTNYINLYNSKFEAMRHSIMSNHFTAVNLINVGNGPVREYSSLWDYGSHEVAMAFALNYETSGRLIHASKAGECYYFTLEFGRSVVYVTVGSGFAGRMNSKQSLNLKGKVQWVDEKKEPLLKLMLQDFISKPKTNLYVSRYVSKILTQVEQSL
jgi:predicted dehydrogenase